jgi:hypothetical protein
VQDDGDCTFGEDFLVGDFKRNWESVGDGRALPATRPETVGASDHQKSDAKVANRIMNRLNLGRQKCIRRDISENDRVVWHQLKGSNGTSPLVITST